MRYRKKPLIDCNFPCIQLHTAQFIVWKKGTNRDKILLVCAQTSIGPCECYSKPQLQAMLWDLFAYLLIVCFQFILTLTSDCRINTHTTEQTKLVFSFIRNKTAGKMLFSYNPIDHDPHFQCHGIFWEDVVKLFLYSLWQVSFGINRLFT